MLLLKFKVTWSISLIHCSVVLWCARKPNWLAFRRLLSSMCFWTIFRMAFSKSLPVVNRKLIGRKFWWYFRPLPGFGNFMTFASFQDCGKWDSRRQWLNNCVKCTNCLLEWCLRYLFGMSSIPQAFLNFKELITFCKSYGLILSGGLFSTASIRHRILASTRSSWFSSHKSWCVNWLSLSALLIKSGTDRTGNTVPLLLWNYCRGNICLQSRYLATALV
jgi:hypothetical protein